MHAILGREKTMIYELRTYFAAPGKLNDLHKRFRTLTLDIFKRYNMDVVAFWTPLPVSPENGDGSPKSGDGSPENGDLVYVLRFSDEAAKIAAWQAFQNDSDWIKGKAASEVNGKLVDKVVSVILTPTDYSPLQ